MKPAEVKGATGFWRVAAVTVACMLLSGWSAAAPITWYRDEDGDGWGDPGDTIVAETQPAGYVNTDGDWETDYTPYLNPGAVEFIDGIDNDRDGEVDENWTGILDLDRTIRPGEDRYAFTADPGAALSFQVAIQGPGQGHWTKPGDVYVAFYAGQLPGSTLSPTYSATGSLWATFSWTPDWDDAGQTFVQEFQGTFPNGSTGLLTTNITVTPEPATCLLIGTGLVGLVGVIRRRRR